MKRLVWMVMVGSLFLLAPLGIASGGDPRAPGKTPDLVSLGKKLYDQNCIPCHGAKGDGKGALATTPHPSDFALPLKDWPNTKGNPEKIFAVITKGIPDSAMLGWPQLSEKERWGLVYRVMEFSVPSGKKGK